MPRKSWYNASAADAVRAGSCAAGQDRGGVAGVAGSGWRCWARAWLYPLRDGPGVALLVFFPPWLWLLSLPIFDWIAIIDPLAKGNWALGLLVLPIFLPLILSFAMTLGYVLLCLGQVLVVSALGEDDHPRWPAWHPAEISEGLARWIWAGLFGLVLGGFPVVLYWIHCGPIDWFDRVVFAELVMVGAGYAEMALAAALLHDSLIAANPYTVLQAIVRVGWDYVQPCLVAGISVLLAGGAFWAVLFGVVVVPRGGALPLGLLGLRPLHGDGHAPDARPDLPRPRSRPALVLRPPEVGDLGGSGGSIRIRERSVDPEAIPLAPGDLGIARSDNPR